MTEEGRQYLCDLIKDFYIGSGNKEGCVYVVQQSNILQLKEEDFNKLQLPEDTVGFYHEFFQDEMLGAYNPFLSVIAKMLKKTGMNAKALLQASNACLYHYDIFLGYFEDGICRRRDWPILTELEYEKTRIMQTMVQMLKILSNQCPIFVLLNNIQAISSSSLDLLYMLLKENIPHFRIIGILNQSAKPGQYISRGLSNLLATCKERGTVSDWTIEEPLDPFVDTLFSVKQADEEKYFVKLNNMLQTLAYEQANNYLTYIGQRLESDTVNVTEQFRVRYLRYNIIAKMFKKKYAMALLSCDSRRKMNTDSNDRKDQIFASYHGAV